MSAFLIDARFLLRNTTETFWGASLIVVDGMDNTFCFGFSRDLLRLRNSLCISAGVIVFGSDASSLATEKDVRSVVDLCRELGILVVEEPKLPVLAIVATHANRFSDIVTDDRRILCFCTDRRAIHLGKEPRSIEQMTPGGVQRILGVPVQHVPTYLALTECRKHGLASSDGAQSTLTPREARRLVELHGALPGIYQHLSTIKSPALQKKLANNQKAFEERYRYSDNTTFPPEASGLPSSLAWNLDGKERETLLRERGFYSRTFRAKRILADRSGSQIAEDPKLVRAAQGR
jgi:hypothetical protein